MDAGLYAISSSATSHYIASMRPRRLDAADHKPKSRTHVSQSAASMSPLPTAADHCAADSRPPARNHRFNEAATNLQIT
jgi:hypothetical protein